MRLGKFSMNGMPPGSYHVLAYTDLRLDQIGNPDFIRAYRTGATEVNLSARETKRLTITAMPSPGY